MVTITAAESNRAIVRYISETVWGTTPATGSVKTMRITSSGIVASKDTKMSDEIRSDRMVPAIIETAASTGGPIECEFSAGSQDDFFEHFLLGSWTKSMNFWIVRGSSVTITGANEITVTGADWTDWLADNQWLKLEGFLTRANNKYVTINGAPSYTGGNTVITVDQPLTVESGSAYTKIMDAGDVLTAATSITFTSGNTIDGGGANAFGSIKVGQKVWVDGLGKETGTIQAAATDPSEGDTIIVSDGVDSVTFEIRTNSALVEPGNVHVALSGTPATLAASIGAAIMDQFRKQSFRISASVATDTATLTNHRYTGGSISSASLGITDTNFSGGSATKGGRFLTVASIIDNDTFTVSETLSTDANSGTLTVVVKGSHVRNPGVAADITKKSVSAETGFTDVDKHFSHTGLRTGSFELSVSAGDIVTVSFELQGRETDTLNTTVLGDSGVYTVFDTTATEVFNATSNVGTVYKDGTALTTAITEITFSGDSNLREQRAVGEKFPAGIGYGRFSLSGTLKAYFQDFTLYDAFINHTTASLSCNFEDLDHNAYWFTMPAVKFSADPIAPGGIDEDVYEEIEFMAFRDANLQTMFMIDRFSSVYPTSAT